MNKWIVSAAVVVVGLVCAACSSEVGASNDAEDSVQPVGETSQAIGYYWCEINAAKTALTGRCNKSSGSTCKLPTSSYCPAGASATYMNAVGCFLSGGGATQVLQSNKRCY